MTTSGQTEAGPEQTLRSGRQKRPSERSLRASIARDPVEWAVFGLLVAGLAWVPLWQGSENARASGINALLFGGITLAYETQLLLRGRAHAVSLKHLAVPAILFLAAVLWTGAQLLPLGAGAARPTGGGLDAGSISINRSHAALALLRMLTAAAVLWTSIQLGRNSSRAHWLLRAVVIIAAVVSLIGLVLWPFQSGGPLRSTYLDNDTFAVHAGMGLLGVVGLLMQLFRRTLNKEKSGWLRMSEFLSRTGLRSRWLIASGLIMLVGLVLSGSRAGFSTALPGAVVVFLVSSSARNKRRRLAELIDVALALTAVIAVCVLLLGDLFTTTLDEAAAPSGPLSVQELTWGSILRAPITGYGAGTFADVLHLPEVSALLGQSARAALPVDAHNIYLETWQGLGLVFGSLLLACLVVLALRCVIGVSARQRGATPCYVALGAAVMLGVDGLVDGGPQIQGITLTFMALLGAGLAQSVSSREILAD